METDLARELDQLIESATSALKRLSADETGVRPTPDGWSKREVLGHLIDSAANNHQRFVRAQGLEQLDFPPYDQRAWVACQRYAECDWDGLIALWVAYNHHLVHVLRVMPAEQLDTPCLVDRDGERHAIPLRVVAEEYLSHIRHHLVRLTA